MKLCRTCLEEKPRTEFFKDKALLDGLANQCKVCKNKKTAQWRIDNREKYNRDMRSYNKKHYPRLRLQRYKLTKSQYDQMFSDQNGSCKLCGRVPKTKRPLAIDHCHVSGRVRGLLCYTCNRSIVSVDDPSWLEKALKYIKS